MTLDKFLTLGMAVTAVLFFGVLGLVQNQQPYSYTTSYVAHDGLGESSHVAPHNWGNGQYVWSTTVSPKDVPGTATMPPTTIPDVPAQDWIQGKVTHYGESFNGLPFGCPGYGLYYSSDLSVAAVAYPSRNSEWPCGTVFEVQGPAGVITVIRKDSCPGCGANHLDLSEAGIVAVCGHLGTCQVQFRVVR